MIVVDTNVVAYLVIPGDRSSAAREVLRTDPDWRAPLLWRSEFRNVLATRLRNDTLALEAALDLMARAETLLRGGEHHLASEPVLRLAARSGLPAYDCEFVALARILGTRLVTGDERIGERFPEGAVTMEEFAAGDG